MSNDGWGKPTTGWGSTPPKEDIKTSSWSSPAAKGQEIGRIKREPPKQNEEGIDDYLKGITDKAKESGWRTSFVEKKPNPVVIGIDPASKAGDKSVIIETEVMENNQFKIISIEEADLGEIEIKIPSYDNETNERLEDEYVTALVIKVGQLGVVVNREVEGRVYHLPTLAKFDSAFPEREPGTRFSRKMLVDWCRRVQDEGPQEIWAIVNALTPETYNDAAEAKGGLREFCRSIPMKEE